MISDLTKLNDEQLRANRFELVSQLADDLAHEIKNPLNAIVINLEVLKVRVGKGDPDAALERAGVIEHEVRRLHHLVDRLLQLLRPGADEPASLALDQVLDEVLPLVEAQVRLARNQLLAECGMAVFVPIRRDVFKFALLNLLTAVHRRLGEAGGSLTLGCRADDREVRLMIGAVAAPDAPPVAAPDGQFEHALEVAGTLLSACGGRVDAVTGGVVVVLPRAGAR